MSDGRGCSPSSLHDVEPATFERCALIRDWLDDLGVDRVTLLVIPAPDLHPFHDRRPDLAEWLEECARGGDAIAQHGFQHRQVRRAAPPRQLVARVQGGGAAEFVGLDGDETRRAVLAGRRLLKLAGIQPRGFVAPAYAYTPALRATLATTFDWWAGLGRLHRADRTSTRAPALTLGTSTALQALDLAGGRAPRRAHVGRAAAPRPAPGRPRPRALRRRGREGPARRAPPRGRHLRRPRDAA